MTSLLKMIALFIVIVLCLHRKVSLGLTLLAASGALAVLFSIPGRDVLVLVGDAFSKQDNATLLVNIVAVTALANFLVGKSNPGTLTTKGSRSFRHRRLLNLSWPVLVGLLPMPGGALFSAPLVDATRPSAGTSPVTLTFVNYWFRHVWEYFLPLYPAIILVSSLSGLSLSWIVLHHAPFALVAAGAGWLVIRREQVERGGPDTTDLPASSVLTGFLVPIAIPVGVILAGGPLWVGVVIGIVWAAILRKTTLSKFFTSLWGKHAWLILLDIAGILVFQSLLLGSGGINHAMNFLVGQGFPVLLPALVLPFLVALLSGFTAAFVGITFPVVLPLLSRYSMEAVLPLIFISGYLGITFSPAHLCLMVSCRYFRITLAPLYRKMLFPAGCVLALAWVRFLLVR